MTDDDQVPESALGDTAVNGDEPPISPVIPVVAAAVDVDVQPTADFALEPETSAMEAADTADAFDALAATSVAGEEDVVDEVIDGGDDFGTSRIIGRENSENGHDDGDGRRRKRGRHRSPTRSGSRSRSRGRSRSRDRDWARPETNGHDSRDREKERNGGADRDRDRDRGRGERDRSAGRGEREWDLRGKEADNAANGGTGRRDRDRGRDDSRDRNRGGDTSRDWDRGGDNSRDRDRDRYRERDGTRERDRGRDGGRDRERGRETTRDRDPRRGSSRDRDHYTRNDSRDRDRDRGREERDRTRGRDRDSFDNTRDRARRDRAPTFPSDNGRGGRASFRGGRGAGAMMHGQPPMDYHGPPPIMHGPPPMGGPGQPLMGGPSQLPMGGPGQPPMGAPGQPPMGGPMGPMGMAPGMMGMPQAPGMYPHQAPGQQMLFNPPRSAAGSKGGNTQSHKYNILPIISFKAFMSEQRDDVTPEECKQRYEEYKADYTQRLTHSFIDVHRIEEWFQERYHPKLVSHKKQDKIKWTATESAVFASQLRANPAKFISSASLEPITETQRWGTVDKKKKRPRQAGPEDASSEAAALAGLEDEPASTTEPNGETDAEGGASEDEVDAKEFIEHADRVVYIRRIPAWISTEELGKQVAQEGGKFLRILASDAANNRNDDFGRAAYIIYATPRKATSASQKINKMRVYEKPPTAKQTGSKKSSHNDSKFFEVKSFAYRPRAATTADAGFSQASRIVYDTKQSLELARALDAEFGLADKPEGIDTLLSTSEVEEAIETSTQATAKLDLVCAYLKRVHFFVYYRGHQCRDEGDMIASRSACRGVEGASKEDVAEAIRAAEAKEQENGEEPMQTEEPTPADGVAAEIGETGKGSAKSSEALEAVDNAVIKRVKEAEHAEETGKKFAAILERYEENVQKEVEEWQVKYTGRTEEGYARCNMNNCNKLFKAPEFVHKHLVNKHPEQHKAVVDEVSDPFVREMFLEDDNKPLPDITADANTPSLMLVPTMNSPMAPTPINPMGTGYPMMGGGMPMGPMGPMGPLGPGPGAQQMGPMGGGPMPMQPPPQQDPMSGGQSGFRGGRGAAGFRGRGSSAGRFAGRGMGRGMGGRGMPAELGARDPRSLVSYVDVDAPKETTPDLDYGDAFPAKSKKKRKTM